MNGTKIGRDLSNSSTLNRQSRLINGHLLQGSGRHRARTLNHLPRNFNGRPVSTLKPKRHTENKKGLRLRRQTKQEH